MIFDRVKNFIKRSKKEQKLDLYCKECKFRIPDKCSNNKDINNYVFDDCYKKIVVQQKTYSFGKYICKYFQIQKINL